jgi:hypothetical protein
MSECPTQIKLRESLMGRSLSELMRKLTHEYKSKAINPACSLEHMFMSFYSNLFQELESSYLKLHEKEIEENKVSLD